MDTEVLFEEIVNVFLAFLSIIRLGKTDLRLAALYILFLVAVELRWIKLRQPNTAMFRRPVTAFNYFIFFTLFLGKYASGQTTAVGGADGLASISQTASVTAAPSSVDINGTPTSFRDIFTVPSAADFGANVIANIEDPEAKDAQDVCPGYTATNIVRNDLGLTASLSLAGTACNVYGNDISTLNLTVEYQSADRLAVRIAPAVIDASNSSQYDLPGYIVTQPAADQDASTTSLTNDLNFLWSNDPTFSFTVLRKSTGDTIFSSAGTKLVFEDQFAEFASSLPENYNLYGLGETIHGLRLGNNFTKTMYAADVGDPIDE